MNLNKFVIQHLRATNPEVVYFIGNTAYTTLELLQAVEEENEILLNQFSGEFINYLTENRSEPYMEGHAVLTEMCVKNPSRLRIVTAILHKQVSRLEARAYLNDRLPSYNDPVITKLIDLLKKYFND